MKAKRTSLETAQETAQELITILTELSENTNDSEDFIAKAIMRDEIFHLQGFVKRLENLITLRDFKGYQFGIIDQATHEVRKATQEEAQRLIMEFPPKNAGGIVNIMKAYDAYTEKHGHTPDTSNWDWLKGE